MWVPDDASHDDLQPVCASLEMHARQAASGKMREDEGMRFIPLFLESSICLLNQPHTGTSLAEECKNQPDGTTQEQKR